MGRCYVDGGNQSYSPLGFDVWIGVCAKTGLEELGDDYASPMAIDDTSMKLWVAEERIGEGHLSDGADMMLRILDSRLYLYAERQKNSPLKIA